MVILRAVNTILVTGAGGMLGRAVCAALRRRTLLPGLFQGARIVGWGRRPLVGMLSHTSGVTPAPGLADLDAYTACDVSDAVAVNDTLATIAPDVVFHVAALNAFAPADELDRVNVGGLMKILAALERVGRMTRLVLVGSAAELGSAGARRSPITEEAVCQPESPYGKSKHRAVQLALSLPPGGCVDAVVARPFNLVGVGLDERLALAAFAKQIAAVVRGERTSIQCGPLHTKRDYLDAVDAAEALVQIALLGRPGEIYNVCSGVGRSMHELLGHMTMLAGVSPGVEINPHIPPGPLEVVGDPTKLETETGWRRTVAMGATLRSLLEATGLTLRLPEQEAA